MGASLGSKPTGTFGDLNTFSTFLPSHFDDGGLLVTDDTELDHLARAIRNHGWARDVLADSLLHTGKLDDPFFEAPVRGSRLQRAAARNVRCDQARAVEETGPDDRAPRQRLAVREAVRER